MSGVLQLGQMVRGPGSVRGPGFELYLCASRLLDYY